MSVRLFSGTSLVEIQDKIPDLCMDRHGCRYLQEKLAEAVPEHRDIIFRKTVGHFADMMTGKYYMSLLQPSTILTFPVDAAGNYLCQKLLEYLTNDQRDVICKSVADDLFNIAMHIHGTRVVQKMIDVMSTPTQASPASGHLVQLATAREPRDSTAC